MSLHSRRDNLLWSIVQGDPIAVSRKRESFGKNIRFADIDAMTGLLSFRA